MDLPDDAMLAVFARARPFEPVLRHVCQRWLALARRLERAPGRPPAYGELAEAGPAPLVAWARQANAAPYSTPRANGMLLAAAAGCNGPVFALIITWPEARPAETTMPAAEAERISRAATEAGHDALAAQAREWLRRSGGGRGTARGVFDLIVNDGPVDRMLMNPTLVSDRIEQIMTERAARNARNVPSVVLNAPIAPSGSNAPADPHGVRYAVAPGAALLQRFRIAFFGSTDCAKPP